MRTKLSSTIFFAVLLLFTNLAKGTDNRDGNWWNHQTTNQKLQYIVGFFDGQIYAEKVFDVAAFVAQADPKTQKWNPDRARITVEVEKFALRTLEHDFGNVSAGQLMAGLDKIYADYRNTRILVVNAMIVVVRSMDGTSDDEITKLLEQKRKEASQ